ncbi:MAG: hypothetical protein ACOY6K_12300 [Pseudomonadota bacterium]
MLLRIGALALLFLHISFVAFHHRSEFSIPGPALVVSDHAQDDRSDPDLVSSIKDCHGCFAALHELSVESVKSDPLAEPVGWTFERLDRLGQPPLTPPPRTST